MRSDDNTNVIRLYHAGYGIIEKPDPKIGRRNADFGQGFYLSDDEEFTGRWARERTGSDTYLNVYELDLKGLNVKRFKKDDEWFDYIYSNRNGHTDKLTDADVIIGPIANDTIYDTLGIITSGLLQKEQALRLLKIGPMYEQVVIKSEKGIDNLHFISARKLQSDMLATYRNTVKKEELLFQEEFARQLEGIMNDGG